MTTTDKADDFTADRHVDLDAGEGGGAMTDADYYDRIDLGAGYREQSTTACCPRQTIPDSCSCLEGCGCLCADCDCGAGCDCGDSGDDYFDLKWENDAAADLPEREA